MFDEIELAVLRRAYARQIAAAAGATDPRIIEALTFVRREDFLPAGPWSLYAWSTQRETTPDADPLYVYQDVPVPLLPEKGLNNGQPSFVTRLIAAAGIRDGERIVHIGTGTGYFTALMAHLVGTRGHVLGIEIEPTLARRAGELFADAGNVRVLEADGWRHLLAPADVVFVNAGTASLAPTWLDCLEIGGRLVVPLAARLEIDDRIMTRGCVLRIERDGEGFAASFVSPVMIYPCAGADDPAADERLRLALISGGIRKVTRLVRGRAPAGITPWLAGEDWYLA